MTSTTAGPGAQAANGVRAWLGDIPAHWNVKPLKHAVTMNPEVLAEGTAHDYEIAYVDIGNVNTTGRISDSLIMLFGDAPTRARKRTADGDTIISTVRTYLKAIAFIEQPPENLTVSTGFAVLRPRQGLHPRFLFYVVQSEQFVQSVVAHSEGVSYPAINTSTLGRLPIWLPPLPTQSAIAVFLDRETARIDALIAKRQRFIELLEEKRSALITHVVTKGLDPDVPMRDSGVDWLGEIPAHWEVRPLKRVARIRYGLGEPPAESPDGVPFVRATDISDGTISDTKMMFIDPDDIPTGRDARLRGGEIIVVRSGAYTGDSAFVPDNLDRAVAGYDMVVAMTGGHGRFMAWQLLSAIVKGYQFLLYRLRAAQPHLNAEQLGRTLVLLPPEDEQQVVAHHLDREMAKIEALVAKVRAHIERLAELRTALVSAAVTGKIDVREQTP